MISSRNLKGFTIVELLIVIVVIGILAAITIVAYNGIQKRTRDSTRTADTTGVMKAIEMYKAINGTYPDACGGNDVGCVLTNLNTYLIPNYLSKLPTDPNSSTPYQYVKGPDANNSYGILVNYENQTACKRGSNIWPAWWAVGNCP